ncbi:16S rRNA (guanine(966)-N(2))-methyltransferase RsmD [Celerinatantimonas yamalensis]|uniref:Ribosomal RNA small subunit methyltransferase D n=1 Tax=Celerinatantimonas yamalensis TaxID=559956 RepID=A0ABW9G718_9GAMM
MAPHSKRNSAMGSIRIIGGQWRGRKLPVLDAQGLRPTTDRVKETLFNWLQGRIANRRCLDLFAGSGGLSFEALSRQASFVQALELFPPAVKQLVTNRQVLQLDEQKLPIQCTDTLQFLANQPLQGFDLVFIDPPFRTNLVAPCCQLLQSYGWLNPAALVYIECEREASPLNVPWSLLKEKCAGQVLSRLYQVEGERVC